MGMSVLFLLPEGSILFSARFQSLICAEKEAQSIFMECFIQHNLNLVTEDVGEINHSLALLPVWVSTRGICNNRFHCCFSHEVILSVVITALATAKL